MQLFPPCDQAGAPATSRGRAVIACHSPFGANLFLEVGGVTLRWSERAAAGCGTMPASQNMRAGKQRRARKGFTAEMRGAFRRNRQGKSTGG